MSAYLSEHDVWQNTEVLIEIIEQLPKGFLRFKMYEQYYSIQALDESEE